MGATTITVEQVKAAFGRKTFRDQFPDLADKMLEAASKPGCSSCSAPVLAELAKREDKLKEYFGDVEFDIVVPISAEEMPRAGLTVINCHIDQLEERLNRLPAGPKQIACARFEDQITVIINDLSG